MNQTVLIRPLPQATPARASIYHLGASEEKVDEGPSNRNVEFKVYLRKTIKRELSQGNRNFLLDLSSVEWIDSTYVGMILAWHQLVDAEGGKFVLYNVSDRSKEIMRVAKLNNILRAFDSRADAQRYFADPSDPDE
jgi:anti-sigma B factor antagonist